MERELLEVELVPVCFDHLTYINLNFYFINKEAIKDG
jgi:hypothetical protein